MGYPRRITPAPYLLAQPIGNETANQLPPLIIDENEVSDNTLEEEDDDIDVLLPKGEYYFNHNIGKYGGYRIPVQIIRGE